MQRTSVCVLCRSACSTKVAHVHVCICVLMYMCMCMCACVHVCVCMCVCVCVCVCEARGQLTAPQPWPLEHKDHFILFNYRYKHGHTLPGLQYKACKCMAHLTWTLMQNCANSWRVLKPFFPSSLLLLVSRVS